MARYTTLAVAIAALTLVFGCPQHTLDDDDDDDDTAPADDDATSDDDTTSDDDSAGDDDTTPTDDQDGDGFTPAAGDCDDLDAAVYPYAEEIPCDQVDSDCDGWGEGIAAAIDDLEFDSLPDAIAAAQAGDVVSICPGIHTEQIYMDQPIDITLTSFSGNPADTILDGEDSHRLIYLGQDSVVTVSHLTIRNGLAGDPNTGLGGGGIMSYAASLTIKNCHIEDNRAEDPNDPEGNGHGGGLYVYGLSDLGVEIVTVRIEDCWFEGNHAAHDGGGIDFSGHEEASLSVSGSIFLGNSCGSGGGAIKASISSSHTYSVEITETTFDSNTATYDGGGLALSSNWQSVTLHDTEFLDNHADYSGGAVSFADSRADDPALTMTGCLFEGNTAYSDAAAELRGELNGTLHICIADTMFSGNAADYGPSAIDLDVNGGEVLATLTNVDFLDNSSLIASGTFKVTGFGLLSLTMEQGSFVDNSTAGRAAALMVFETDMDEDVQADVLLDGVLISGNVSTTLADGSALQIGGRTTLDLIDCTIVDNPSGGAVLYYDPAVLNSVNTDWGSGATDNGSHDVMILYGDSYLSYGAGETFTCTGDLGCL
jgi:hypothetical protein